METGMILGNLEMRRLILPGAMFLVLISGASHPQSASQIVRAAGDSPAVQHLIDPEIAEATFRYQFAHNASSQQADAKVYCIGFGLDLAHGSERLDPSQDFLSRLYDVRPPVKA